MHLNSPEQPGLDPVPGDRHRVRRLGIRRRDGHHHHRLIRLQGQLAPNSIFLSSFCCKKYLFCLSFTLILDSEKQRKYN